MKTVLKKEEQSSKQPEVCQERHMTLVPWPENTIKDGMTYFPHVNGRLEPLLMGHFGSSHPTVGLVKKIQLVFPLCYLWHVKSDVAS